MIDEYRFTNMQNYVLCVGFFRRELQEVYYIPKMRSRLIINLQEDIKREYLVDTSISILVDILSVMTINRFFETGDMPLERGGIQFGDMPKDVTFYTDDTSITWEQLKQFLADNTALTTKY